jgi:hypothetical protein
MGQWGSSDASSNSVLWAPTSVNKAPTATNRNNLYGNTTADAFITGQTVGMFGVDTNEMAANNGSIAHTGWILRTVGSGGRAGRVQTEVLVAGGIGTDGADDTVLPDYRIVINTQPANATANTSAGANATFTVAAVTVPTGGSLSYAWKYANGGAIQAGANVGVTTGATLVVNSAVQTANASFKVEISTTGGAANVTSANATLTITT